jgi:hypothetical protein
MAKPLFTWSYSSLSLFQQCPKKYYHLRVAKDIVEPQSKQMLYGTEVHKAAEDYVRDGTPIPPEFAFIQPPLDALKKRKGEKLCEFRLGLTEDLEPCDFFAKDVWWRGIADLIIQEDESVARTIDYKTGKPDYADTKQLEILSLAIFKHFPKVKIIKCGLLFVVHPRFIPAEYTREKEEELWKYWKAELHRMKMMYQLEVWNPTKNFTCKNWCPVTSCHHNGRHT